MRIARTLIVGGLLLFWPDAGFSPACFFADVTCPDMLSGYTATYFQCVCVCVSALPKLLVYV